MVQKSYPSYSDGTPIGTGDELEVSYPDLHGIPHRGLVYRLTEGLGVKAIGIIHNSKLGGGVCFVNGEDFAQGQVVRLRRRPSSPVSEKPAVITTGPGTPFLPQSSMTLGTSSRGTTISKGRSCQRGCGMATTAASATAGCRQAASSSA